MKKILALISLAVLFLLPVSISADVSRVSSIAKTTTIEEGYYALRPACAPNRALTIRGYSGAVYTPTVSHTYTKNASQIFYIEPSAGGTYRMICKKTGMALSVKNASTKEGAVVRQSYWGALNSQRWYFMKHKDYVIIQSSISKKCLTVYKSNSANDTKVYMHTYHKHMPGENWKLVKIKSSSGGSTDKTNPSRKYKSTINGKRTLTSYLKNSFVACGRTLYIWGGGWGGVGSDSSIIGYQSSWSKFFSKHATASYDYTKYRYDYGKGLDCSGFAAWVLYNTLYTTSGRSSLVTKSTSVASFYNKKKWATLAKNGSDKTFKPGDVVSMNGHVWISLGQCSDKSVLLIHSSPKGVQISGTSGAAASLAAKYMKKYFPEWPYAARTVSRTYLNYVGKARWRLKGTGSVMRDPDGIQKMSANQVIKFFFGS